MSEMIVGDPVEEFVQARKDLLKFFCIDNKIAKNIHIVDGVWGEFNETLYWASTVEELKTAPQSTEINKTLNSPREEFSIYLTLKYDTGDTGNILILCTENEVELNEEYEMLQLLAKTVVLGLAPKIVELASDTVSDIVSHFMSDDETEEGPVTTSNRKKSDTTKITQYMYDFVVYTHADWQRYNRENPKNKKTTGELVETINDYMLTDKGRTALASIWNGHVDRDSLAAGKPYFDYPSNEDFKNSN